ncbi:kelch-like protein 4 [Teleopsis dalmanni]|uniref:kelch-like protein 4 n=1 Tax=Teleopsis dalmanni TaxID=139649 RepID=UPI0018CDEFF9|nr:kelch-like protein 4 [Teleopsis dalmanni]
MHQIRLDKKMDKVVDGAIEEEILHTREIKKHHSILKIEANTTSPENLYDNLFCSSLNFLNYSETEIDTHNKVKKLDHSVLANKNRPRILSQIKPPCKKTSKLEKFKEISLDDMGFNCHVVKDWDHIKQPFKESLSVLLRRMVHKNEMANVEIRIGPMKFRCHLIVLQCYSSYFNKCKNETCIYLPENFVSPGSFMMLYNWMLSENPLLEREGILELFIAASFLGVTSLINHCWICLDDDERFREDSAFMLYLEARDYGLSDIQELMLRRICKFFLILVASKEFLLLKPYEIKILLQSNNIGANSEVEIFLSMVRWLNHDWVDRKKLAVSVMKRIRFSLMPPWYLVTLNKKNDCPDTDRVIDFPEVKKFIGDAISFTTTQMYYGNNKEDFMFFLEKYNLHTPPQRQWIIDLKCFYHHRLDCSNMQYITYQSFKEYLKQIQRAGVDYWRTFFLIQDTDDCIQCCTSVDNDKIATKFNAVCEI